MEIVEKALKELIRLRKNYGKEAKNLAQNPEDLEMIKRKIAKNFKIANFSNVELLKAYHNSVRNKRIKNDRILEVLLRKRKIRSLSGIVVVSVLTKPYPCPGKCVFCPSQKGMPKSYLKDEPAVMRAVLNKFDPYMQVECRLSALEANGHPTDKVDLRIIGGTWSFYPREYQKWFIIRCLQAANNGQKIKNDNEKLENAQKKNERAKHRIIGITIETRPDYISEKEIKWLRELGVTRVELGVQSLYDDVLKLNKRGHLVKDTIKATKLLKDAGLKLCYQIMPNLWGSNLKKDRKMFEELFKNSDFRPDMIKIYPLAVLKQAKMAEIWKKGKYKPYNKKQLIDLIKYAKKTVPSYVRIQRIIRDIPKENIIEGPARISNIRQIILKEMKKENWKCRCIRCREVGENYDPKEKLYLFRTDYESSGGKEIFLSYESKNQERLYSLLRLRICDLRGSNAFPVLENAAIIRELHTYGQMLPLEGRGKTSTLAPQHKGLGKKLMEEAERIAKNIGFKSIAVISGIGARGYYKKLGYKLKDTYMIKNLE